MFKKDIIGRDKFCYLLSRVYLYMGANQLAREYANKVINSSRYELADTQTFREYFLFRKVKWN